MKRILFVLDEKCIGGVVTLLKDMLKMSNIADNKVDILVLHNRGSGLSDLPENVNVIYGTKFFDTIDLPLKEIIKKRNLWTLIRKTRLVFYMKTGLIKAKIKSERAKILYDKYDYEIAFKDGFTAIFTAYGDSKIKYHWIQFNYSVANPNAKYDKLFKTILPMFDKIISVSEGIKRDFNSIYNLGDKVQIIENIVNIEEIRQKAKECNIVTSKDNLMNLVSVGRLLNSHKGYDRLIDVIYKLSKEGLFKNAVLKIYGDGPDKKNLQDQIIKLGLKNKVIICGMVSNPYKYIINNDLFIMPSRYEAFGLVIVESLALGVPVLSTNNDATKTLIDHECNGYIVDNDDDELYAGLKYILQNKEVLTKYKTNLKKYNYNNKIIVEKINNLFM